MEEPQLRKLTAKGGFFPTMFGEKLEKQKIPALLAGVPYHKYPPG